MLLPENVHYTNDHEWVRVENGTAIIGVTDYAQGELGDVVFVELPEIGRKFSKTETIGTIEAVKTVADLFAPVSGEVIETNTELGDNPDLVNSDPYGRGWMVKIKFSDTGELTGLMNSEEYKQHIAAH